MRRFPAVVAGTGVAGLVAAYCLGRQGVPVALVGSRRRPGGHFAGVEVAQRTFDLGMVFFEFSSFQAEGQPPVAGYDDSRLGDSGRFVQTVEAFIRELGIPYRAVVPPEMVVNGALVGDIIIANRLAALRDLPAAQRQALLAESAAVADRNAPCHASRKRGWDETLDYSLEKVSQANHGPLGHEIFIESLCRKVAGRPSRDLVGKYHRSVWAPLYYPETWAAALRGDPVPFADTEFHYPCSDQGFAVLGATLAQALAELPQVTWIDGDPTAVAQRDGVYVCEFAAAEPVAGAALVWSLAPEKLLNLAGRATPEKYERASLGFVFAAVDPQRLTRRFSTLHLLDREPHFYRITNQTENAGSATAPVKLVAEYNLDQAAAAGAAADTMAEQFRDALHRLELLAPGAALSTGVVKEFRDALVLPTPANVALAHDRRRALRSMYSDVHLIGAAAPPGAWSLNDQIVQGLKAAGSLR